MLDLLSLDPSVFSRVCIAAAAGALLCLDKIAVQFMLSRPLVAATIIGAIMGTPLSGLTVGALIEIFWVNKSPLGTYMPPHDSLVAILITITLAVLGDPLLSSSRELLVMSFLVYLPLGHLCQKLETLPAWFNNSISEKALRNVESSGGGMCHISPTSSLVFYFCFSLVLIASGLAFGLLLIPILFKLMPPFVERALVYVYYALPLIGIAVILTTTQNRKTPIYFALIFISCTLISEILVFV